MKNNFTSSADRRWKRRYERILQRKEEREYLAEIMRHPTIEEAKLAYDMIRQMLQDDPSVACRMSYDELMNDAMLVIRNCKKETKEYLRWDTAPIVSFLESFHSEV